MTNMLKLADLYEKSLKKAANNFDDEFAKAFEKTFGEYNENKARKMFLKINPGGDDVDFYNWKERVIEEAALSNDNNVDGDFLDEASYLYHSAFDPVIKLGLLFDKIEDRNDENIAIIKLLAAERMVKELSSTMSIMKNEIEKFKNSNHQELIRKEDDARKIVENLFNEIDI